MFADGQKNSVGPAWARGPAGGGRNGSDEGKVRRAGARKCGPARAGADGGAGGEA